jgi:DNA (cytosine-5)-methyltransferase 1
MRMDAESETLIPSGGGFDVTGCLGANGKAAGSATMQDAYNDMLITHSLRAEGFDASEDGTGRGIPMTVCLGSDPISAKDVAMPITNRNGDPGVIAFTCKDHGTDAGELAPTMRGMGHDRSHPNAGGQLAIASRRGVRRLTPLECERLQGFPDGYTQVRYRRKPAADGPRYKALGNSMARPVMEWLGRRIDLCS